jgi:hypothetical protein
LPDNDFGTPAATLARCLHGEIEAPADPDLARVLAAWPNLPLHIRAAVLALIGTVG